jgi:hypothetical protein
MTLNIKDTKPGKALTGIVDRAAKHFSEFLKTAREFFEKDERIKRFKASRGFRYICRAFSGHWLLCFFVMLIIYLETVYRFWLFRELSSGYFFAFIFAFSGGTAIYMIVSAFPVKRTKAVSMAATLIITVIYGVQLIYYCIFRTPLSLISVGGAGDAMQFWDIALEAILKNIAAVLLLFIPFAFMVLYRKKMTFREKKPPELSMVLAFCVMSYFFSVACVAFTGDEPASQNTLYFETFSPELSVDKLGVLTTIRLDVERLAAGALEEALLDRMCAETEERDIEDWYAGSNDKAGNTVWPGGIPDGTTGSSLSGTPGGTPDSAPMGGNDPADPDGLPGTEAGGVGTDPKEPAEPVKPYNVMDIDFDALMASGKNDPLYPLHQYFSSVEPTPTNEYTGIFKGCNLIMFTAEGFSPYAVSPELTPTLYKMINEGFVFRNFYTPVWWVSTSDGEYVACTGLIPKGGVWSMARSGSNYMPFVMGNQFRNLGYLTKAYHNHTYTYYKRDVSHPNMGYDYKGVGNGLEVKKTWPESDLEMIEVTVDEYIDKQPFHAYYMTVSGHMNYSFSGNQMSRKNREYVDDLPYSDASKAYIACNLELEFAMKALMDRLEAAGIAENTVIVLSADHYPYGLPKENIDELAGHTVESNFELYRNHLIIYRKGMDPVIVDKPCESLDIIPTLSNLFGLEYDSRLLMGEDILSSTPPLVIFSNRSWITDRAMYNSTRGKVTFLDGTEKDDEYVKQINREVADKFKYSAKILETDYYGKIFKQAKQQEEQEASGD